MLPIIGLIAAFLLLSAGAAAGKIYHKQVYKPEKKSPENQNPSSSQELEEEEEDLELGGRKLRDYNELEKEEEDEEEISTQLMKVHALRGLPRFLHTIVEETSEDMASDDGRRRTRMCLKDLMRELDGNVMSPIPSPVKKSTRALTGAGGGYGYGYDGSVLVNGMFDSPSKMKKPWRSVKTVPF